MIRPPCAFCRRKLVLVLLPFAQSLPCHLTPLRLPLGGFLHADCLSLRRFLSTNGLTLCRHALSDRLSLRGHLSTNGLTLCRHPLADRLSQRSHLLTNAGRLGHNPLFANSFRSFQLSLAHTLLCLTRPLGRLGLSFTSSFLGFSLWFTDLVGQEIR